LATKKIQLPFEGVPMEQPHMVMKILSNCDQFFYFIANGLFKQLAIKKNWLPFFMVEGDQKVLITN
jgi:hypothetical protein